VAELITNKGKQKAVSDHTERPNRFMKKWASCKIRNEENAIIEEQITERYRSSPGKDKLSNRKRSGYCPVCLGRLRKNAKNTRYELQCRHCNAVLQRTWVCKSCNTRRVWVGREGARCKGCGKEQSKKRT
jgi:hypothetical protein